MVTNYPNELSLKRNENRRTNPVEVLYASFPFFLYLNATWGGQLLTPLLEFQDSSQWTQPYAARDLGQYLGKQRFGS